MRKDNIFQSGWSKIKDLPNGDLTEYKTETCSYMPDMVISHIDHFFDLFKNKVYANSRLYKQMINPNEHTMNICSNTACNALDSEHIQRGTYKSLPLITYSRRQKSGGLNHGHYARN